MFQEVSPAVVDLGPGEPEVAVVAGVHGDEPSGVRAVRSILADQPVFERGIRFVLGNPPAYVANQRFLDADLNRVFPGDRDGEHREQRLAARLCEATSGMPTLSLHSTHSTPEPIALVNIEDSVAEIADELPLDHVVDETTAVDGSFTSCSAVVTVEVGCQGTEEAVVTAEEQTLAFLTVTGAIDPNYDGPGETHEKRFYRIDDTVDKPPDVSYDLRVDNFRQVEPGTTYATAGGRSFVADRAFVPILMSECGYDEIFGYLGTLLGSTLEQARSEI